MIEILVMLFVVFPWFYRTAKRRQKNPIGWIVIGALSYYIPFLIVNRGIMPAVLKGHVTMDNIVAFSVLSVVLSLCAGIGCCILARQVLLSGDQPIVSTESTDRERLSDSDRIEELMLMQTLNRHPDDDGHTNRDDP